MIATQHTKLTPNYDITQAFERACEKSEIDQMEKLFAEYELENIDRMYYRMANAGNIKVVEWLKEKGGRFGTGHGLDGLFCRSHYRAQTEMTKWLYENECNNINIEKVCGAWKRRGYTIPEYINF